jgi:threonine dehydrogenase-like Zn-dependent dehydrogenase
MRALYFDGQQLTLHNHHPDPQPGPGEALLAPRLAGICATDLEILHGYAGFVGIPGHEGVATVVACDTRPDLVGQRVVCEINLSCGQCPMCRAGLAAHCTQRAVIGIRQRPGLFAEQVAVPVDVLHRVPDAVSDTQAVFVEPLAAACQVTQLVPVAPSDRVVVLGGGRLGLLVAQVLRLTGCELHVLGRRAASLARATQLGLACGLVDEWPAGARADVVVECTGHPAGFATAMRLVRPRGTIVLKSTYAEPLTSDMSRLVVDEIRLVGSRCGPFPAALRLLQAGLVDPLPLVDATFPLAEGVAAMAYAAQPGVSKVLLAMETT